MHRYELSEKYLIQVNLFLWRNIKQEAKDIAELFFDLF